MKTYFGIADSLGIESFLCMQDFNHKLITKRLKGDAEAKNEANEIIGTLIWRANANFQRYAVIFMIDLEDEEAKHINQEIEKGNHKEALIYLKSVGKDICLAKTGSGNKEKMWRMIPVDAENDPFQ